MPLVGSSARRRRHAVVIETENVRASINDEHKQREKVSAHERER
jgi:hypothetical protein